MTNTIITRNGPRFTVVTGGIPTESCLPMARKVYDLLINDGKRLYVGNEKRMFRLSKDNEHIEDFIVIVDPDYLGASHNDLLQQRDGLVNVNCELVDHNLELWEMVEAGQGRIAELERENRILQNQLNALGQTAVSAFRSEVRNG